MTTTRNASADGQLQTPPDPAASAAPVVHVENPGAETLDPAQSVSYLQSIADNYSQYRATAPIPWGNALAFNAGDAVPADYPTLAQLLEDGLVEKITSSARSKRK